MLETLETRRISGKGILKMPEGKGDYRRLYLRANLLRLPVGQRIDRDFNPQKSYFASLVLIRNDDVVGYQLMEFENQMWDFLPPYDGELLIALKCAYQGTLQSFANLGTSLGLTVTSVDNKIKDYTYIQDIWEEVRVTCYGSSAIELTLIGEDYDTCDDNFKKPAPPPPKPPSPPPPPLPPTQPSDPENPSSPQLIPGIGDLSAPYDSGTSDNGNTAPFATDENPPPEPPTQGVPCGRYKVTYSFSQSFGGATPATVTRDATVFGKIGQITFNYNGSSTDFILECQGYISGGTGSPVTECQSYGNYIIGNNGFGNPPIEVISISITMIESA